MRDCNIKYQKVDLSMLSAVDIYKLVLDGTISRFPNGFWEGDDAKTNAIDLIKWLIEEKLKWSDDDIRDKLSTQTFRTNRLSYISIHLFKSNFKAINAAYPNKFKPWEFTVPNSFWQGEEGKKNAIEATKWLIEEKLKWSDDDIRDKLNTSIFIENGLGFMVNHMRKSCFDIINVAYPKKFKPWELHAPKGFWEGEEGKKNAIEATKWLIEEKLKWSDDDIRDKIMIQTFIDSGLGPMLNIVFDNSPWGAIDVVYPKKFKPWEFKNKTLGLWGGEVGKKNAIEATKWLMEEKLNMDINILKTMKYVEIQKLFIDNGLRHMFSVAFKNSIKEMISCIFNYNEKGDGCNDG